MKALIIFVLAGTLAGIVVASWIVPPALSWYASPGGLPPGASVQAVVQITDVVAYATSRLIRGQQIGGAIGAIIGLAAGLTSAVRERTRRHEAAPTPPPA